MLRTSESVHLTRRRGDAEEDAEKRRFENEVDRESRHHLFPGRPAE
jgi:hypothetical protein